AVPKQEIDGTLQIYWAGIPGNEADFPMNDSFDTFIEQASCFLNLESNYRSSAKPATIRFGDRLTGRPIEVDLFDEPMRKGIITNRGMFVCGSSGGGKSMLCNHILRSLYDQGAHIVVVDIGHSYKGLCELADGYYFTYTEKNPIRFNPFFLQPGETLDTEKKESLKALLVTLWKQEHETFNRSEYVALSNAIQGYYFLIESNRKLFPCFNSFYEYLESEYVEVLKKQRVKERDFDVENFLYVLRPYYKGGEFDYLLNAQENLDLLGQRFIVFELDNIKDHPILFPVVTLIIMELFISKMRKIQSILKVLEIEEAWKAMAKAGMAEFMKYGFKTLRKFYGIPIVVTQEIDDLISSPIIKDAIIGNSDIKILMDMRKFTNKFDQLQATLGMSEKGKTQLFSLNRANEPGRRYREFYLELGGQVMKVLRYEPSPEEYYTYTTEQTEKVKVLEYAKRFGSYQKGIEALVADLKQTN
ncbi:MAG TPA: TraG family conjugative transposon ATPase, partial [Puia sp.]|nr:TraG family conjugative transposon ATPase [Puia sp.]